MRSAKICREVLKREAAKVDAAYAAMYLAGRELARAETLAYSKAHPRRLVTYCSAMGFNCLHVSPGGTLSYRPDYQLTTGEHGDFKAPAWMEELDDLDSEYRLGTFPGPYLLKCKGGKILDERTDW